MVQISKHFEHKIAIIFLSMLKINIILIETIHISTNIICLGSEIKTIFSMTFYLEVVPCFFNPFMLGVQRMGEKQPVQIKMRLFFF